MTNNLPLDIVEGSLIDADEQVIVNPANSSLIHAGGLAAIIAKEGGTALTEESEYQWSNPQHLWVGQVYRGRSGALKQELYHAITMAEPGGRCDAGVVNRIMWNLMEKAERDGFKTIGIPAFGTGVGGLGILDCVEEIVESLNEIASTIDVTLYLLDTSVLEGSKYE